MRKIYSFIIATLISACAFMATAQAQSLDEMLANPKVDDIFVTRLDSISDGYDSESYGFIRVIDVNGDSITVITEATAWEHAQGSLDEIDEDFSNVTWDFDEEIKLARNDLSDLKGGIILKGRRLTAEEIKKYLD